MSQVCPLLLRVFPKLGGHHRLEEFVRVRTAELDDEVQIYTWLDATLRELSDLVKEVSRGQEAGSGPQTQRGSSTSRHALLWLSFRGTLVFLSDVDGCRVAGSCRCSRRRVRRPPEWASRSSTPTAAATMSCAWCASWRSLHHCVCAEADLGVSSCVPGGVMVSGGI